MTNTSRASVYNNIFRVGEYDTPGELGNRVFKSTDYCKTFKISRLPELIDRIDHAYAIVYKPYEQLVWIATGHMPTSCFIFFKRFWQNVGKL